MNPNSQEDSLVLQEAGMESASCMHLRDSSFEDGILHSPEFASMDLDTKVACLMVMRDVCEELLRHDVLDLFYIRELCATDYGFRCAYGFSGSRFDDPSEHRMRLSQVPDEVFESIAADIAMIEFCSARQPVW